MGIGTVKLGGHIRRCDINWGRDKGQSNKYK